MMTDEAGLSQQQDRDYRVRLDAFEGPMDLLLYLIRKHEVEVEDIPIAVITDQFLDHLNEIRRIDIESAGEFLVMAATLMEIKSRLIGPPEEGEEKGERGPRGEDEGDPRADLVRQLLAYKRNRDLADALEARRETWEKRFPVKPAHMDDERVREAMAELGEVEIEDVDLQQLAEAFASIAASVNFDRLGEHEVLSDDTPIEVHAEHLLGQLEEARLAAEAEGPGANASAASGTLTLRRVLTGRTKPEMVGLFLALLTLVRDQKVGVEFVGGEVVLNGINSNA
ncbi:MAG: segregation/condensation protein A [Planctomycetota bacterium]